MKCTVNILTLCKIVDIKNNLCGIIKNHVFEVDREHFQLKIKIGQTFLSMIEFYNCRYKWKYDTYSIDSFI